MIKDDKFNFRWLFLGFLIGCVLFLVLSKAERAEAANYDFISKDFSSYDATVEGLYTYYVNRYGQDVINERPYYLVIRNESGNTLHFVPTKEPVSVFYRTDGEKNYIAFSINDNVSFLTSEGKQWYGYLADFSLEFNDSSGVIYSNYVPDIKEMTDFELELFSENYNFRTVCFPSSISYFGNDFFYSSMVTIPVNDAEYIISEALPYYLVLKESDGSIRLFFSEVPFTGDDVDSYTRGFYADATGSIITYYWDATEQNSFLDSRTFLYGPFFQPYSYLTNKMTDYVCNYHVCKTSSLLDIYLPEKLYFTSPEDNLTAKDLFSVMPDELYNFYYCIVFRQNSPKAYDERIIFYGWNETNANLYIKKSNSQIAALTSKASVSDYITAYYDPDFGTWTISDDVVLGATRDGSFNLPVIYHSDVDLFVCDEWREWEYVGYMGDANRPIVSFEEPDEDDTLIGRLLNGLSKMLKNLFVPSSGFMTSKINYMKEKFVFYESIVDTANVFLKFFAETDFNEPPKITVDLSLARSKKYNYGGEAICLDMSWYEEYKPTVDTFLSSVLWIVFAWNTFRNLPSIISGVSSAAIVTAQSTVEEKPIQVQVQIPKDFANAKTCPPDLMGHRKR